MPTRAKLDPNTGDAILDQNGDAIMESPGILEQMGEQIGKGKDWIDQKLAQRRTSPDNTTGPKFGPVGNQVEASLEDWVRGGVRSLTSLGVHPLGTSAGMGTALQAGEITSEGMYPSTGPTTRKQWEANKSLQPSAEQALQPGIKSMMENKADTAGSIMLPLLVGAGLNKAGSAISDAAAEYGGYRPLIRGKITDILAPGTPEDLLMRALKPANSLPDPQGIFKRALPDVVGAAENRPTSVNQIGTAADRARNLNQGAFKGLFQGENYKGEPIGSTPVSTTPIAEAMKGSVSPTAAFEDPLTGKASAVQNQADFYAGRDTDLSTVDNIRETRNAELNNIFATSPAERNSLIRANPEIKAKMAGRDAAADTSYGTLSQETGVPEEAIRANRNAYGDVRDFADVANKRDTVYGRQNPISLAEQISLNGPGRIRNFIFNRIFKDATGSDALVDAATRRYLAQNPESIQTPQIGKSGPGRPFQPAGLLGPGAPEGPIDSATVGLPDSALNNPMGWSGNTTGAQVPIGTYRPPIGYPAGPTNITPPPRPTLELPPPSNDFMMPQQRGPIQLGPGPQPTGEVLPPGSSQPVIPPRSKLPEQPTGQSTSLPTESNILRNPNPEQTPSLTDDIKGRTWSNNDPFDELSKQKLRNADPEERMNMLEKYAENLRTAKINQTMPVELYHGSTKGDFPLEETGINKTPYENIRGEQGVYMSADPEAALSHAEMGDEEGRAFGVTIPPKSGLRIDPDYMFEDPNYYVPRDVPANWVDNMENPTKRLTKAIKEGYKR